MTSYCHCGASRIVKDGRTSNGKQPYKCHVCRRSRREAPALNGYISERKEEILRAYHERTSLRGL